MTYVELDKRICPDTWQSEYFWYDVVQHRVLQVKQGSSVEMLDRQLQIKIQHMFIHYTHTQSLPIIFYYGILHSAIVILGS